MLIPKKRFPIREILTVGLLPSGLKKKWYRFKGYRIADKVHLGIGSVIVGEDVEIGEGFSLGFLSVVKAKKIRLGRFAKIGSTTLIDTVRFELGEDSRINEQVFIGGIKTPESSLVIGKRAIIMQMSFINPTLPITIGDDTGIGGHCLLFTHGSWSSALDGFPVTYAPIVLEDKVWLPWRVFVLPGVTIGEGCVIGADSTVNKSIPPRSLAAGSPAKVIKSDFPKKLTDVEKERLVENILREFMAYLDFNQAQVTSKSYEKQDEYTVQFKGARQVLYYQKRASEYKNLDLANRDVCLTWAGLETKAAPGMWVSLEDRARYGSSPLGEELISFLSRYGIRFQRLD